MAEYIERDALLGKLQERDLCLCVSEADIKELPASDVAPVVHGRWRLLPVSIRSVKKTNIPEAVCSICGERFCDITNNVTLYRYCPNCGAKMGKEEPDEQ